LTVYEFSAAPAQSIDSRGVAARLMKGLLFVTLLVSPFVFIEPSPYEAMFALLALGSLFAGLKIDRRIMPLALLLLLWNAAGAVALMPMLHDQQAIIFMATSFYLAINAVLFACLFTTDVMGRLATLRTGYVLAAVIAALIGLAMYCNFLPNTDFIVADRIRSTFKDPNVFGPFLVLPALFLIDSLMRRGFGVRAVAGVVILLVALFLSFSRGAWAHFLFSATMMMVLMFLTSQSWRFRARVIAFALMAAVALAGLLMLLLSVDAIATMFQQRGGLLQEYDAGQTGRFGRQLESLVPLLELPLGIGPLQFAHYFGQDPHNVYLNAFMSYGWVGGIVYVALVLATLAVGLRAVFVHTPWQPNLILVFAAFTGAVLEGFVIDTDHWRHYYLLLGVIWGLAAATNNFTREARVHAVRAIP
jgi:hypothetical protein